MFDFFTKYQQKLGYLVCGSQYINLREGQQEHHPILAVRSHHLGIEPQY